MKYIQLKFRAVNKDIFEAIRSGAKKVETRAATEKYRGITRRDVVTLVCDGESFEKTVKSTEIFSTISALLKKYVPQEINPVCATEEELTKMYYSFPGYEEKIAQYGLIAMEIE